MPRQKYLLSPRSFKEFFILPHLWFITLRVATISITKGNIVMNDPPHIYWAYIILRRRFSWTSWWGLFWNYIIYTLLRHSYVWQSKVSIVSCFIVDYQQEAFQCSQTIIMHIVLQKRRRSWECWRIVLAT